MKNQQRGFIGTTIVVIVVLVIIGLGIWWYMNTSNSAAAPATSDTSAPTTATPAAQTPAPTPTNAQTNTPMTDTNTGTAPQTLPGGLVVEDIKVGTGAVAQSGKTLSMKYTGTLDNGSVFDSTDAHGGQPFQFTLGGGQVIPGWDQGIVGMKVGGVRELTIPATLGYGAQAVGPIPANSTLHFTVELVSVQ